MEDGAGTALQQLRTQSTGPFLVPFHSEGVWSASFKVIAIALLKKSSCKDKAQKFLETESMILQDSNISGSYLKLYAGGSAV